MVNLNKIPRKTAIAILRSWFPLLIGISQKEYRSLEELMKKDRIMGKELISRIEWQQDIPYEIKRGRIIY